MATFKAVINAHQKKQDGTYNIKIRVTHNRRKKEIATQYYVYKEDITKSLKIKNHYYIDATDTMIREYRKRCDQYANKMDTMSVEQVIEIVSKSDAQKLFDLDFVAFGNKVIKDLMDSGHEGNAKLYGVALRNLVLFAGRESVSVHEITTQFVKDWIKWLKEQPARSGREKGGRAESLYPGKIRALHNLAKNEYNDEDTGIVRIPLSPFKKISLPSMPEQRDRSLSIEQVRQIFALPDTDSYKNVNNRFNFARDMFMLSFMLVGMNEVDLYNCNDYKDGRITYKRQKITNRRKDKGKISIKVEPEAAKLIEKYRDPTGERVFKFYRMYSSVNTFTAAVNGRRKKEAKDKIFCTGLKKVGAMVGIDDLEYYAARHSWASIARNDLNIDKYTVHEALNHVVEEMKVTELYLKKDWSPIDRANRRVIDYVLETKATD
ncbi:transposase [Bacteroidia bacterium]|nr:transposase [Bacteroidia bacterium]